jgi:hypothetical protein
VDTRELERYFELVTSVREALRRHDVDADAGSSDDGARIRAEGLA